MSLADVFWHDLLDVRRSRLGPAVLVVYLVFMVGVFVGATNFKLTMSSVLAFLHITGTFVFPLVALVAASAVIAGARESGRIRFLLGFPNNRLDVVLGTFLSRALLVGGSLVVGFTVVGLLGLVVFDQMYVVDFVGFGLLTVLFVVAYVGFAVGISAWTASQVRAAAIAMGSFLFLNVFWGLLTPTGSPVGTLRSLFEVQFDLTPPSSVYVVAEVLSPVMAYTHALQVLGPIWAISARNASSAPRLASPALAISVLIAWAVVPLALGYWQLCRAEID